jgi:hypothetical protein
MKEKQKREAGEAFKRAVIFGTVAGSSRAALAFSDISVAVKNQGSAFERFAASLRKFNKNLTKATKKG